MDYSSELAILGAQSLAPKGPHQKAQLIEPLINDVGSADDNETTSSSHGDSLNDLLYWAIINMGSKGSITNGHMDLSTIQQPKYVTHQSPASAYHGLMSGQLATIFGNLRFVPDAARARQACLKLDFLVSPTRDEGVETQEELAMAKQFLKCTQTGAPRFLFRGFYAKSGGGIDPRLNGPAGVVPHAFLDGKKPTSMWDIEKLAHMINKHIDGDDSISSAFSSWSHDMTTAFKFSRRLEESTIAVLDTASLREHVYFTEDFWRAGLADMSFKDEFMIYGPISGPHYHTVSLRDLRERTRLREINSGTPGAFGEDRISSIERGAVESSREIATFLQPRGTSSENILILTARFVGVRVAKSRPEQEDLSCDDMHGFLYYARDDLQALAMRHDATEISLVEPTLDTSAFRGLSFEVQLQQVAEDAVHVLGWGVRAAVSRLLTTTDPVQLGDVANYVELHAADEMELCE